MLIGVVSDTHGHVSNTQQAVRLLQAFELGAILHCGDICSLEIPELFKQWPTHFVFGNCDYDRAEMAREIQRRGMQCHDRFGEIQLLGRKIALLHSDDATLFQQTIHSNAYDLVCYGHTHIAKQEHVGKTLVLNPGALYRAKPLSVAVVDLTNFDVHTLKLD